MKPSILFVDDEINILDSLRLSLRPMRVKWNMSFALGGKEALDMLTLAPYAAVVSDMRMPGIDGAQLLKEVQLHHPQSLRIILSGYSDEESVLKTVKLAHQYLSKPCRPVDLIKALENALSLRDALNCEEIKSVVSRLDSLPSLPDVYRQLVAALQDENSNLKELGDIVSKDVAMTATILRLSNSAFFGLPTHISGIHHAVNLLGGNTLRGLVLSTHLFTSLKTATMPSFSVKLLWEHSLRVGCFAKAIAESEGACQADSEECFIAGMLHDVGKLVLATGIRAQFEEALALVRENNCLLHEAEHRVFGTSHAAVGAYLMSLWGFCPSQLEAVCWHHDLEKTDCQAFSPQLAVHLADSFDHELVVIHPTYARHPLSALNEKLCIPMERLHSMRSICESTLRGTAHG